MHNKQANWEVIIGSVMISFSAIFVKLTTTGPTVDGFYRMLFGGIGLVIITLIRKENYRANWPSYAFATLAGVLFALDLTFWHQSIMHIGPGLATVIVNLQVFILGIIGFTLYGDLINWKYAFSIPIAM
ncbi:MAG: EamA family transporter, partial [Coxiellaceae bacterium]|nr:EamA family transporter [Coxiellaceae bacterium]